MPDLSGIKRSLYGIAWTLPLTGLTANKTLKTIRRWRLTMGVTDLAADHIRAVSRFASPAGYNRYKHQCESIATGRQILCWCSGATYVVCIVYGVVSIIFLGKIFHSSYFIWVITYDCGHWLYTFYKILRLVKKFITAAWSLLSTSGYQLQGLSVDPVMAWIGTSHKMVNLTGK